MKPEYSLSRWLIGLLRLRKPRHPLFTCLTVAGGYTTVLLFLPHKRPISGIGWTNLPPRTRGIADDNINFQLVREQT